MRALGWSANLGHLHFHAAWLWILFVVVRSTDNVRQPFTGTVELTSSEVAEDLAVYLRDSEQVSTAFVDCKEQGATERRQCGNHVPSCDLKQV